ERAAANDGNTEGFEIVWGNVTIARPGRFASLHTACRRRYTHGGNGHQADAANRTAGSLGDGLNARESGDPEDEVAIELEQARLGVMQVGGIVDLRVRHAPGLVTWSDLRGR